MTTAIGKWVMGVELSHNTADSILYEKKRKVILFIVVLD